MTKTISMIFPMLVLLLFCVCTCVVSGATNTPSLVITMICRDEAVNFRANLAEWLSIVDYYVFMVDARTKDQTVEVIKGILEPAGKMYHMQMYEFTGFGPARTLSLETAWTRFPQASHVLVADPDWKADVSTMNLMDLSETADVYRFTAFDRNGYTKRRMDWLMRHRQGLAMRYNLHEVLDIGRYNMTMIPWVVHEIEKPGSWHTTVGHAHSMSPERYKFDLSLLYKDLMEYGHDPHTHYYLGVTHEAYANLAQKTLGLYSDDVQAHLDNATHYLALRATAQYEDEFVEQRWAVMLQLGIVYTFNRKDDMKAIYWLSMCRDYKQTHSECSLALCQLYVKLGQLTPALREIHTVLQKAREERQMLEYLTHWECRVPTMALQLFANKAFAIGLETDEAMYFFVLWKMAHSPQCPSPIGFELGDDLKRTINAAVRRPHADFFRSPVDHCADPVLQGYLLRNNYQVHNCEDVRRMQVFNRACVSFTATSLPAAEEMQASALLKMFYGAAILPDIVHHAFRGHIATFLTKDRPLRFLFAEHFHPEMVFNLIGQLQRQPMEDFEIVVVTPDKDVATFISNRLMACSLAVTRASADRVHIHVNSLLEFAASFGAGDADEERPLFDYIEYNGGLSKAADPQAELRAIHALSTDDGGAVGLTYFARNHHVNRLRQLVDDRARMHMVPFSLEATRLVKSYLEEHGMGALTDDTELVRHLGGESADLQDFILYQEKETEPRADWRVYNRSEAVHLVDEAGFEVASWVPTAYSHPYEEIDQIDVQRHAAAGISEEDYLYSLMTSFRFTTYLVKRPATGSLPSERSAGRLKISRAMFLKDTHGRSAAGDTILVDRVGYLGASLQGMEQLASQRQSTSLEFAHNALPGTVRFTLIVSPVIGPCLPHLSSRPTIQALHEMNRNFAVREGRTFDEREALDLLIELLYFLEQRNLVTFEVHTSSSSNADGNVSVGANARHGQKASASKGERVQGGLKVKMSTSGTETTAAAVETTPVVPVGPLTQRMLEKNPTFVEKLREAGNSDSVIEDILLSEERRREREANEQKQKNAVKDSGDKQQSGKVRSMADHLKAMWNQN